MRIEQEKVEIWMEHHRIPTSKRPTLVSFKLAQERHDLIKEELEEYLDANRCGDLVRVADALGDLLFTVLGTAVTHGINAQPVFQEIVRSNCTKGDLSQNRGKGVGYQPPRLAAMLLMMAKLPDEPLSIDVRTHSDAGPRYISPGEGRKTNQ